MTKVRSSYHSTLEFDVSWVVLLDNPLSVAKTANIRGVVLDLHLDTSDNIKSVCRSAAVHLNNIAGICSYKSQEACGCLIHAFDTSRVDYGNSPLCHSATLPKSV